MSAVQWVQCSLKSYCTILLICGGRELALAKKAFLEDELVNPGGDAVEMQEAYAGIKAPGSTISSNETALLLPKGYVSRKAQFVPALFKAIQNDFDYEKKPVSEAAEEDDIVTELRGAQVQQKVAQSQSKQKQKRRQSSLRQSFASHAMEMLIPREKHFDEEMVKANDDKSKERSGNLSMILLVEL